MALYEEVYYQLKDYPKFYRYEGVKTHRNYNFEDEEILANIENYIYFSKTLKHHEYYVQRRIRQQIEQDILYQLKYTLQKRTVINNEKFQEIVTKIENYPLEIKPNSIEFTTSPLVKKMFTKNYIVNLQKRENMPYIERVDRKKSGGGYGLCKDWLEVFNILTYIYAYHRITKNDMLDFLYALRRNLLNPDLGINPTSFLLNPRKQNIRMNNKLYSDFAKYDLMNALQNIVEKELFFPESYFAKNPNESVKKIIQAYTRERECILELTESIYKRNLTREL